MRPGWQAQKHRQCLWGIEEWGGTKALEGAGVAELSWLAERAWRVGMRDLGLPPHESGSLYGINWTG